MSNGEIKKKTQKAVRHQQADEKKLLSILAVLILMAAGLFFLNRWENRDESAHIAESAGEYDDGYLRVRYQGKWYQQNPDIETLLLIGVDRFEEGDDVSQQADFLALLLLDKKSNSYTALQLNRDTMVDMPMLDAFGEEYGTKVQQLALSYTYGSGKEDSCRNTVQAVSNLLYGVKIDHYLSVTMDAVPILNDLVGGVTVHVVDDFSNVDSTIVQGEDITLQGDQSLHYVRARAGMEESTNTARMERQRTYLDSLRKQLSQCVSGDDSFALNALTKVSPYMVSDCNINDLSRLFDVYAVGEIPPLQTIAGESVKGMRYMEFHADNAALEQQVIDLFFTIDE